MKQYLLSAYKALTALLAGKIDHGQSSATYFVLQSPWATKEDWDDDQGGWITKYQYNGNWAKMVRKVIPPGTVNDPPVVEFVTSYNFPEYNLDGVKWKNDEVLHQLLQAVRTALRADAQEALTEMLEDYDYTRENVAWPELISKLVTLDWEDVDGVSTVFIPEDLRQQVVSLGVLV